MSLFTKESGDFTMRIASEILLCRHQSTTFETGSHHSKIPKPGPSEGKNGAFMAQVLYSPESARRRCKVASELAKRLESQILPTRSSNTIA